MSASHDVALSTGKALRALLVEDNPGDARLLEEIGSETGLPLDFRHVGRVADALTAIAADDEIDFIISDLGLPDATGYELMTQLRERFALKGIAVTGSARDSDVERGRAAGFSAHLVKPFSLRTLEQALEDLSG